MKKAAPERAQATPGAAVLGAALALPETLLEGGETILRVLKPSPLSIPLSALPLLALIAGVLAFSDRLLPTLAPGDRILGALGLSCVVLTWHLLGWLGKTFILTDRRVLRLHGVLRPGQIQQLRLKEIHEVAPHRHLLQQVSGLGSVRLSGVGVLEWEDVAKPLEVAREVTEAVRRYGR